MSQLKKVKWLLFFLIIWITLFVWDGISLFSRYKFAILWRSNSFNEIPISSNRHWTLFIFKDSFFEIFSLFLIFHESRKMSEIP